MSSGIQITHRWVLPESELTLRTSRSGGPGGQNVNKVETRVELVWDLEGSPSVGAERRAILRERLASRLDKEGRLSVVSQATRSQARNREDAENRLIDLLRNALRPRKRRKRTRVPRGAKRRRLENKRHKSRKKRDRQKPRFDE